MHQQSNATPASNLPAVIPPEATGALYKDSEPTLPGVEPPHHPPITLSALAAKVNPPIKRHHLSAMFGDMAAQDFGDFCAGIAGNPGEVVLYDGKVVDGYHRYVAEYAAGIPSTFLTLAEWAAQHHVPVPDVLDFVVDRNKLRRRHDDLMVGVELKHAYSERAEARKLAGVKAEGEKGRASDLAAAQLGNKVSPDTIDRADKLLTENPDIKEELKQGTTTWKKARATAKTRRGGKKKKLVNTPAPEQTSEPQTVSDFNPDGDGLVDRFETQEEVAKRQTEAQKKSDEELEKKGLRGSEWVKRGG